MSVEQLNDPTLLVWLTWTSVFFLLLPGLAVGVWDYRHYYRGHAKTPMRTNVHFLPVRHAHHKKHEHREKPAS